MRNHQASARKKIIHHEKEKKAEGGVRKKGPTGSIVHASQHIHAHTYIHTPRSIHHPNDTILFFLSWVLLQRGGFRVEYEGGFLTSLPSVERSGQRAYDLAFEELRALIDGADPSSMGFWTFPQIHDQRRKFSIFAIPPSSCGAGVRV
jgi:hypothetical protein